MSQTASTQTAADRKKRTRAQATYTIEERIKAVSVLTSMGGVHKASREQIRQLLGRDVNVNTLHRWQREIKPELMLSATDQQPKELDVAKLVADTRQQLLTNLASVAAKASNHLNQDKVIDAMSGRDAAVVVGISAEKMLLMAGRSPELDNLVQRLIDACNGTRWQPSAILEDVIKGLEYRKQLDNNTLLIEASEDKP